MRLLHACLTMTCLAMALPALAGSAKDPPRKCAPDAVRVGPVCVDRYEASIWFVPPVGPSGKGNKNLIKSILDGSADYAALVAGGATHVGCPFPPYNHDNPGGFPFDGNWVPDPKQPLPPSPGFYAVSIPGVLPSACLTWFQAEQACALSDKRLLTNQEWQRAAAGTPDPGTDNGTTDCNVLSEGPSNTGARKNCVSAWGVYDMVGNVWEWVGDWGDLTIGCTNWTDHTGLAGGDLSCVGGDGNSDSRLVPGALVRGGAWHWGVEAGVFTIGAYAHPHSGGSEFGFRCGR